LKKILATAGVDTSVVVGAKCTIFEYRSTKNNNGIVTGLGSVKLSGEIHGHLGPSVGGNLKWL
jgi:hypothetical protein